MVEERIGFGGGCHWCTEGVFQALRGVVQADQGFLRSDAPWETPAEGVVVRFDPAVIGLSTLAEIHLRTHSANGSYSPGGRYRSAIYVFAPGQRAAALDAIDRFARETGDAARTMVLAFVAFEPSEERYRNYYRTDPERPFCRRYIDPKLDYLRRHFAENTLPDPTIRAPEERSPREE